MELFMSLKKLTESIHKKAEETKWSQLLVSGDMNCSQYGQYLYNLLFIYSALEGKAAQHGVFKDHPNLKDIQRIQALTLDRGWYDYDTGYEPSAYDYVNYLETCDREQILAHMYVRHLGDMYGGQIISKNIPCPSGSLGWKSKDQENLPDLTKENYREYFTFKNKPELIATMRSLLSDEMADEAVLGFQFAINLFNDLEKRFDL